MGFFAHTPGGSGYARASHAHTPTLARLSACGKYAALFFPSIAESGFHKIRFPTLYGDFTFFCVYANFS